MDNVDKKRDLLLHLSSQLNAEITRYRDYEWQITAYIGALFVWVITMILDKKLLSENSSAIHCWYWTVLSTAVLCFGIVALVYVHLRLNNARNLNRKINHLLGLFEPLNILPEGIPPGWCESDFQTVLPAEHGSKISGVYGVYEGIGVLFLVCFMLFLVSLWIFELVLIWSVPSLLLPSPWHRLH